MSETEPTQPGPSLRASALAAGHLPAGDPLARALLTAQRLLRRLDVDPDVRLKLHLRYAAICTSLKMPAGNRVRGAERLERLIADVGAAGAAQSERQANQDAKSSREGEIPA